MNRKYGMIGIIHKDEIETLFFGGLTYKYSGDLKNGYVVFALPENELNNPNYMVESVYKVNTALHIQAAQKTLDEMCDECGIGMPVLLSDPYDLEDVDLVKTYVYDVSELDTKLALGIDVDWVETELPPWAYSQFVYIGKGFLKDYGKYPYEKSTEGKNVSEAVKRKIK